jgi:hypothetical protein
MNTTPGYLREAMNDQEHPLELLIMCVVIIVFSVLGLIGSVSAKLFGDIDGLLLIAICLVMFLTFSILLFVLARERGWLGKHEPKGNDATTAPAKK